MANKNDALVKGLLGLGLGVLVGAAISSASQRNASKERLRARLAEGDVALLEADVGRQGDHSVWVLTVEVPNQGVLTVQAALLPGQDPHTYSTCDEVAKRVLQHLG